MSANDNFSLHDDEELSLHDDASLDGSVPASNKGDAPAKPPQIITTNTLSNIKLPVLQKDDYDTWAMEMEHYLEYIDNEAEQVADEKERKARTLLLMAVPKDHLRRFHGMDDAKEIWAAIKTRFGGNANSKKMQKAVLKQQFEAFTISSKESLEKGYDRFQKLLSQLDALGASVSDEDANHKFLRSLPPAWDSLAMTMRTKKNIDTLSIDDLYNNLSVFEQDIQKTSSSSLTSDNVAFLSQAKASSSKHKPSHNSGSYSSYTTSSSKATPTATPGLADEVIHSFLATNADDVDLIHEDLDQIDDLDLEEMDINWQIAMTAIKIKKFYKKTGRRPRVDGKMHVAFDKRKVECFNCHNTGHFARECKFKGTKDGSRQEASRGQEFKPVRTEKEALMTIDEGQINWVEQTTDEELNHALMAFTVNNEIFVLRLPRGEEEPSVKGKTFNTYSQGVKVKHIDVILRLEIRLQMRLAVWGSGLGHGWGAWRIVNSPAGRNAVGAALLLTLSWGARVSVFDRVCLGEGTVGLGFINRGFLQEGFIE
ncbi:ribonuclease H-like domain-containing protein [Tanacetum coccineum]